MGNLVSPEVFKKWQAIINNSKCVERVIEIREEYRKDFPQITLKARSHAQFLIVQADQIDLFTNFLLDMNEAEPLLSDSIEVQSEPKDKA